jgi:DNA adenine methylase
MARLGMFAMTDTAQPIIVPFLKWAGGKRWLTSQYSYLFPTNYDRYVEPFLGSGAVFFHLAPAKALISDSNAELINVYREVRSNWEKVELALRRHHRNHGKKYYYAERNRKRSATHEKAAQFIYLNRTCWNGLYRVNLRGDFNVPIGTKSSVRLPTDDFKTIARLLRQATILASDFETVILQATEADFLFVDPPYITRHNFNGFVKYNYRIFSWDDQKRLADALRVAAHRGTKILMTNADHDSVRALYRDVGRKIRIRRHSVLAANSNNRGQTTELAVLINYNANQ